MGFGSEELTTAQVVELIDAWIGGDLSRSIQGTDELSRALARLGEHLRRNAQTHLARTVTLSVDLNDTARTFGRLFTDLRGIQDQTNQSAAAAEQMLSTADHVLQSTELIAAEAEQTRLLMDEGAQRLTASTDRIEAIVEATDQVQRKVGDLLDLSKEVRRISASISQIANQTNLLALNATIEAARAGESGRGFAVVAGEVKNLAQQTDGATKDIETIVGRIQTEVLEIASSADLSQKAVRDGQSSVKAVAEDIGGVKSRVDEIVTQIASITQLFSEHRAAGQQVATSVVDITTSNQAALDGVQLVSKTMDALEKTILSQLDELARLELPGKVVQLAKSDHVIWKKRLAMMAVGQLQLDPKELADHHSCRLGRWYDQQSDCHLTGHPAFAALADPHQRVHAHGIRAAQLMTEGQAEAANRELILMEKASEEVMQHLTDLERTARGE